MSSTTIFSTGQTSRLSKVFRVDADKVMVISSFNFAGATTDELGEVIKPGDCAVLHKIEVTSDFLPQLEGCTACANKVLEGLEAYVSNSEPVMSNGELWVHDCGTNVSVLSVPGLYMFEMCDGGNIGSVSIAIEELDREQAKLLPRSIFHGE